MHCRRIPPVMGGLSGNHQYCTNQNGSAKESEKKRETMLKYLDNDVARTTGVMDLGTELGILDEYRQWIADSFFSTVDSESQKFLHGLWRRVDGDFCDMLYQAKNLEGGVYLVRNEDGTYTAETFEKLFPDEFDNISQSTNVNEPSTKPFGHDAQSITSTTSNHISTQKPCPFRKQRRRRPSLDHYLILKIFQHR